MIIVCGTAVMCVLFMWIPRDPCSVALCTCGDNGTVWQRKTQCIGEILVVAFGSVLQGESGVETMGILA